MNALTPDAPGVSSPMPRLRLHFLDGMRGLAALYVVIYHVYGWLIFRDTNALAHLPPILRTFVGGIQYGRYSVDVFICLSGYCLMLPVVRAANNRLDGGLKGFFKRRARRILPTYYGALALSVALAEWHAHKHGTHFVSNHVGDIVSHLFLVHNIKFAWYNSINYPMWSIATEWQIYFLFPLLLLPVWRRFGNWAAIAAGFLVGFAPHLLLPAQNNFDWAAPWYVGLFAMGMAAAALTMSDRFTRYRLTSRAALIGFGLALIPARYALVWAAARGNWHAVGLQDSWMGCIAICLILYCARAAREKSEKRPALVRFLEAPATLTLGMFSYSLYLVHSLVIMDCGTVLDKLKVPLVPALVLMLMAAVPLAVGVAYLFYLVFERPFTSPARRVERKPTPVREPHEEITAPDRLPAPSGEAV
ncbi:MAG TPA: acyltransferase [Chthonomonadaceae bacterium]|nr:acyltransferase [Chthonomonadaceae bacterium]